MAANGPKWGHSSRTKNRAAKRKENVLNLHPYRAIGTIFIALCSSQRAVALANHTEKKTGPNGIVRHFVKMNGLIICQFSGGRVKIFFSPYFSRKAPLLKAQRQFPTIIRAEKIFTPPPENWHIFVKTLCHAASALHTGGSPRFALYLFIRS